MDKKLEEMYMVYVNCAAGIPGFKVGQKRDTKNDIQELANNYIKAVDNNDSLKQSQYLSALMVRYFHMVPYLYERSKTLNITIYDIVSWLSISILKAMNYRSWLNSSAYISKDPHGAEKCINQCITSHRVTEFYLSNMKKRAGSTSTASLDALVESNNSYEVQQDTSFEDASENVQDILEYLVNKKLYLESIVFSSIYRSGNFNTQQVIRDINNINIKNGLPYIKNKTVNTAEIAKAVLQYKSTKQSSMKKLIKQAFTNIQNDMNIREALCY